MRYLKQPTRAHTQKSTSKKKSPLNIISAPRLTRTSRGERKIELTGSHGILASLCSRCRSRGSRGSSWRCSCSCSCAPPPAAISPSSSRTTSPHRPILSCTRLLLSPFRFTSATPTSSPIAGIGTESGIGSSGGSTG